MLDTVMSPKCSIWEVLLRQWIKLNIPQDFVKENLRFISTWLSTIE